MPGPPRLALGTSRGPANGAHAGLALMRSRLAPGASADFYQTAPWMIVFPGVAITLAVFAFNLFGDSLRDWLGPKLKS